MNTERPITLNGQGLTAVARELKVGARVKFTKPSGGTYYAWRFTEAEAAQIRAVFAERRRARYRIYNQNRKPKPVESDADGPFVPPTDAERKAAEYAERLASEWCDGGPDDARKCEVALARARAAYGLRPDPRAPLPRPSGVWRRREFAEVAGARVGE